VATQTNENLSSCLAPTSRLVIGGQVMVDGLHYWEVLVTGCLGSKRTVIVGAIRGRSNQCASECVACQAKCLRHVYRARPALGGFTRGTEEAWSQSASRILWRRDTCWVLAQPGSRVSAFLLRWRALRGHPVGRDGPAGSRSRAVRRRSGGDRAVWSGGTGG
jgi:hypothetical protein